MTTLEKITSVLSAELDVPNATAETTLEDLGLDSLEFANLILAIARAGIADIPEKEWEGLNAVGDLVRAAEKYAYVPN